MSQSTLPPELYRNIALEVEKYSDLFHLSLVSRAFSSEANRCLYSTISFDEEYHHYDASVIAKLKEMLKSLPLYSRLSHFIEELELVNLTHTKNFKPEDWIGFPEFIASCSNLKRLYLPYHHGLYFIPPRTTSLRLRTFVFIAPSFDLKVDSEGQFNTAICEFLSSQSELLELRALTRSALNLPPGSLPKLKELCGHWNACRSLLPGRPVRELELLPALESEFHELGNEVLNPPPLGAVLINEGNVVVLQWLSEVLGKVEELEVNLVTERDFELFKQAIHRMPRLQSLCVNTMEYPQPQVELPDGSIISRKDSLRRVNSLLRTFRLQIRNSCPLLLEDKLNFFLALASGSTKKIGACLVRDPHSGFATVFCRQRCGK